MDGFAYEANEAGRKKINIYLEKGKSTNTDQMCILRKDSSEET